MSSVQIRKAAASPRRPILVSRSGSAVAQLDQIVEQPAGSVVDRKALDLAGDELMLTDLDLDPALWVTVRAESRTRTATGPDGQIAELEDVVVLLRRR